MVTCLAGVLVTLVACSFADNPSIPPQGDALKTESRILSALQADDPLVLRAVFPTQGADNVDAVYRVCLRPAQHAGRTVEFGSGDDDPKFARMIISVPSETTGCAISLSWRRDSKVGHWNVAAGPIRN